MMHMHVFIAMLILDFTVVINANNVFENFKIFYSPMEFSDRIDQFIKNKNTERLSYCDKGLKQLSKGISTDLIWALQMFDAAGKLPPGVLRGNDGDLGAYDECLKINTVTGKETIVGKYCLGKLNKNVGSASNFLDNSTITENYTNLYYSTNAKNAIISQLPTLKFGACLPHSCTADEFHQIYKSVLNIDMIFSEDSCQTSESTPELDGVAIGTTAVFGAVIIIMIISTLYDVYKHYTVKDYRSSPSLLTAFSIFTNGKKLIKISSNTNQISCLHGIRVISLMWIILGHRKKMLLTEVMLFNKADVLDWIHDRRNSYMLGASVSVDTFLLLSGLVISYSFVGAVSKKFNFNIVMFYVHRYLRLTPPYAVLVLINVSLMKHLASGPQWPMVVDKVLEQPCRDYWWSALLYVQNYVNPSKPCMGQTWYLSVDTQLFIISPLLILSFYKWPQIKPFVLTPLILGAGLVPFLIMFYGEYSGLVGIDPIEQKEYVKYIYYPTHARAAPWLVGLAAGYVMYESKHGKPFQHLRKHQRQLLHLFLWLASLTVMCAVVFGAYNILNHEYDKVAHSMYIGFGPLSWAVGVGCLIFLCVQGYGGPVNWLLSNPLMQVISRLSYSMYLLHKLVMSFRIYTARTNFVWGDLEIMPEFWGDFILTMFLAVFWVLAFESPIIILEKLLFHRGKGTKPKAKPDIENGDTSKAT